ncbi:MAG: hypothetical protein FWD33_03820 [Alphaproteobacteria bacterium]|nr:hypothetical protein [Alphaproteobacteria bacterium]
MSGNNQDYIIPVKTYNAVQEKLGYIDNTIKSSQSAIHKLSAIIKLNKEIQLMMANLAAPVVLASTISQVDYVEYNFDAKTYNTDVYFDQEVYKDQVELDGAKIVFEEENVEWELVAIRSMCAEERLENYKDVYAEKPISSKDGTNNACELVVRNKGTTELIESGWVFRMDCCLAEVYARRGLSNCAFDLRNDPGLRDALVAALSQKMRG